MDLTCWQCGYSLEGVLLPLSRREECPQCRAEIHTCRQCEHYDAQVSDQCREDRAEQVSDKTRANFCDYFQLKPQPTLAAPGSHQVSEELAGLFGLPNQESAEAPPGNPLDELFKDPKSSD